MTKEEKRRGVAAWGIGMCLFASAMSLMLMKFGSIMAVLDLDFDLHLFRWIVSAYAIFEIGIIPVAGRLVDYYGEKRILVVGAIFFVFGSVLCATAWTMLDLVLFRCIQGIGGGIIFSVAFSAVGKLYRQHKRNYAHEIMTGAFAFGSIYATMVGWWFVQNFTWRHAMFAMIVIMLIGAILAYFTLPDRPIAKHIDVPGLICIGGIFFLAISYTQMVNRDFNLISTVSLNFLIGELLFILFLVYFENRAENPAFPIHMSKLHLKYMITMFVLCIAAIGLLQYIMKMLLMYYNLGIYESSAMFLCLLAGGAVTSMVGCRKVTHTGIRVWVFLGSLLLIFGFAMFYFFADMSVAHMGLCMIIIGLGLGCMVTQLLCSLQGIVPQKDMGVYSSTLMGIRMVGIFLGNAIFSYVIKNHMADLVNQWRGLGISGDVLDLLNIIIMVFGGYAQDLVDAFDRSVLICAVGAAVTFIFVAALALWMKKDDLKAAAELPDNQE